MLVQSKIFHNPSTSQISLANGFRYTVKGSFLSNFQAGIQTYTVTN